MRSYSWPDNLRWVDDSMPTLSNVDPTIPNGLGVVQSAFDTRDGDRIFFHRTGFYTLEEDNMAFGLGGDPHQVINNSIPPIRGAVTAQANAGSALTEQNLSATYQEILNHAERQMNEAQQLYYSNPTPRSGGSMHFEPIQFTGEYTASFGDGITLSEAPKTPRRKKLKIAKIRSNVSEAEVAKAITKHTEEKAKSVVNQASAMEASIVVEENILTERKRTLDTTKNKVNFYKAQKDRLTKSKKQLLSDFEQAIIDLKQEEQVQDVTIDSLGRIIVTTTPVSIKKEDWDEPQVAGVFQIRIDFSRRNIRNGVRALNITQNSNHYDSPTISNTFCCWGNISRDIKRDFLTQNITELVLDMIAYVGSPNEQHGYMGVDGDSAKGWEQFFATATKHPEGYSWEEYEKTRQNGVEGELSGEDESIDLIENTPTTQPQSHVFESEIRRLHEENRSLRRDPQNPTEDRLLRTLESLGLVREGAMYVLETARQMNLRPYELRLEDFMPVAARLRLICNTESEPVQHDLMINAVHIRPGIMEVLRNSGTRRERLPMSRTPMHYIVSDRIEAGAWTTAIEPNFIQNMRDYTVVGGSGGSSGGNYGSGSGVAGGGGGGGQALGATLTTVEATPENTTLQMSAAELPTTTELPVAAMIEQYETPIENINLLGFSHQDTTT